MRSKAGGRHQRDRLLREWRVITASGAYAKIFAIIGDDLDGAEVAVGLEVCRLIGNVILAAKFILNFGEGIGYVTNLKGEKSAASGGIGHALQDFIAGTVGATHVGADGIDDGIRPLRHLNRFLAGDVALIVFSITEKNNGPAIGPALLGFQQLVAAGIVERVVERRAPAGTQFANAMRQLFRIVR